MIDLQLHIVDTDDFNALAGGALTGISIAVVDSIVDASTDEVLSDAGRWSLTVAPSADCRAELTMGRTVVFAVDGNPISAGLIRKTSDHRIAKEGTETYTVSGPTYFNVTDRASVDPTLGYDRLPFGPGRTFSFASPEYDETALFVDVPLEITPTLDAGGYLVYSFWIELPSGLPAIPGGSVHWIGPVDDDRQAPQGYIYLLHDETFADPFFLRAFQAADNQMLTFADGFNIPTTTNLESTTQGFTTAAEYYLRGAAGTHRFASKVINVDPTTGGDPGFGEGTSVDGNPMGTIGLWFHTTAAGELLDKAFQTTDGWKMLAYPDVAPGMAHCQVARIVLAENQAGGILPGFTFDVTDLLDSNGNAMDIVEFIETQVGDSLAKLLKEWGQTYCDSRIDYSQPAMQMFRLGEAGVDSGVTWAYSTDRNVSAISDLLIEEETTDTDVVIVQWEGGQTRVPASGGTSKRLVKSAAKTIQDAIGFGNGVLTWQNLPEACTAVIQPTGVGDLPGRDALLGDVVHLADGLGGTIAERMYGWGLTLVQPGGISWRATVKARNLTAFEALDRLVQQQQGGTIGGRSSSQPVQPPARYASQASTKKVQLQPLKNADGAWPIGIGAPEYVEQPCNMHSVKVHLDPVSASDVVLDVLVDGVTIIGGPQTVPAGATGFPIPVAPFGAVTTHYLTPANPITLNLVSIDVDVDHMTVDPQTVA